MIKIGETRIVDKRRSASTTHLRLLLTMNSFANIVESVVVVRCFGLVCPPALNKPRNLVFQAKNALGAPECPGAVPAE